MICQICKSKARWEIVKELWKPWSLLQLVDVSSSRRGSPGLLCLGSRRSGKIFLNHHRQPRIEKGLDFQDAHPHAMRQNPASISASSSMSTLQEATSKLVFNWGWAPNCSASLAKPTHPESSAIPLPNFDCMVLSGFRRFNMFYSCGPSNQHKSVSHPI